MRRIAAAVLAASAAAAVQVPFPAPAAASPAAHPSHSASPRYPAAPLAGSSAARAPVPPAATTKACPAGQLAPAPARRVTGEPWAQRVLNLAGAGRLARGHGITVAVIDSGVAPGVPQLAGRVAYLDLTGTGTQDCVGHGTAVAAIIAATDEPGTGRAFAGVAPGAHILSVKVQNGDKNGNTNVLAQAIRAAVDHGARVINVSIQAGQGSPVLLSAVRYALRRDVVVVAAAGNKTKVHGKYDEGPYYPASYPGVLSVGSLQPDGSPSSTTALYSNAGVAAPGVDITSAWPGGYASGLAGTSFAAPFVAGVAALIRSAHPQLGQAQVVRRIEGTADGGTGPGTGAGMVNPLQAISAVQPSAGPTAAPAAAGRPVPVRRPPPPDRAARVTALAVTAGSLGLAAAIAIAAMVITAGRRRRQAAS